MLLAKLMWIIQIVAILFGAGTRAHPVCAAAGKPGASRIAISVLKADKPLSGDIEDGFCVQPQSDYAKEFKVDKVLNCETKKSSWTMSHLKREGVQAIEELIKHKDLAGLMRMKREIRRLMPLIPIRKAVTEFTKIE